MEMAPVCAKRRTRSHAEEYCVKMECCVADEVLEWVLDGPNCCRRSTVVRPSKWWVNDVKESVSRRVHEA